MAGMISETSRLTQVKALTATGTDDTINSASVDMGADGGWDGVFFFFSPASVVAGAATAMHIEQSADDSSFADLTGTGITIEDDDDAETFGVDVYQPGDRYLRMVVTRATQASVLGEMYALRYRGKEGVITQSVTDEITVEAHVSPAEGTI